MLTENIQELQLEGKTIEKIEYRRLIFTDGSSISFDAYENYGSIEIDFEYKEC